MATELESKSLNGEHAEEHAEAPPMASEKMTRIRELIFGQQMREYGHNLQTVDTELARLQEEIQRLAAELQEINRQQAQQIQRSENRLAEQIREIDERLTQQIQNGKRRQEQIAQEARQLLHAQGDALRQELRSSTAELDERKVDRFALGEFFVQLGTNLKENHSHLEAIQLFTELTGETNHHEPHNGV